MVSKRMPPPSTTHTTQSYLTRGMSKMQRRPLRNPLMLPTTISSTTFTWPHARNIQGFPGMLREGLVRPYAWQETNYNSKCIFRVLAFIAGLLPPYPNPNRKSANS